MSLAIHLGVLILGAVIVLATLVCLVIDMVSRVDYLKEKFPRFARILERRDIIGALALAGVLLFLTDLYEVIDHEIPVVQGPVFQVNLPAVPIQTIQEPCKSSQVIVERPASLPRHLSDADRIALIKALAAYPGQKFTIDHAVNDSEAYDFGVDIRNALEAAGWQEVDYAPIWDPNFSSAYNWPNYFGVQWFVKDQNHVSAASYALRKILIDCCGIEADGVVVTWPIQPPMEQGIIYIWVGPKRK